MSIRGSNRISIHRLIAGTALYCLTTAVVLIGMSFGAEYIPSLSYASQSDAGYFITLANWDGVWYSQIMRDGYSYEPAEQSSVAFFPLYPAIASGISCITQLRDRDALLVVSHLCLLVLFVLSGTYVRERFPEAPAEMPWWTLLALGLWPPTLFFRMTYTESMFLLLLVISLWGMQRQWPVVAVAVIVGLATACRATAMALLPTLLLYNWQRCPSKPRMFLSSLIMVPVGCWGLLAYMAFQYREFGDAFAFVRAQEGWAVRHPSTASEYAWSLATLEPLWAKYCPSSSTYWARHGKDINPLFSLEFGNPIYFGGTALLIFIGIWRKWLNSREFLLAVGLLAIPYLTHSYRSGMMGHARYSAVVFPAYLVMGQLLCRMPSNGAVLLTGSFGLLLGIYSALFASWYPVY